MQHAATATIVVWLFIIEHARRVWPRVPALLAVAGRDAARSRWSSRPGLHNGFDPIVKGPWYFLGLQEILHWTPWPLVVVAGGDGRRRRPLCAARDAPASRAACQARPARPARSRTRVCAASGRCCAARTGSWTPTSPAGRRQPAIRRRLRPTPDAPTPLPAPLPLVAGRPEGCLVCHTGVTGLGQRPTGRRRSGARPATAATCSRSTRPARTRAWS